MNKVLESDYDHYTCIEDNQVKVYKNNRKDLIISFKHYEINKKHYWYYNSDSGYFIVGNVINCWEITNSLGHVFYTKTLKVIDDGIKISKIERAKASNEYVHNVCYVDFA